MAQVSHSGTTCGTLCSQVILLCSDKVQMSGSHQNVQTPTLSPATYHIILTDRPTYCASDITNWLTHALAKYKGAPWLTWLKNEWNMIKFVLLQWKFHYGTLRLPPCVLKAWHKQRYIAQTLDSLPSASPPRNIYMKMVNRLSVTSTCDLLHPMTSLICEIKWTSSSAWGCFHWPQKVCWPDDFTPWPCVDTKVGNRQITVNAFSDDCKHLGPSCLHSCPRMWPIQKNTLYLRTGWNSCHDGLGFGNGHGQWQQQHWSQVIVLL